jgi:hypothetical protein
MPLGKWTCYTLFRKLGLEFGSCHVPFAFFNQRFARKVMGPKVARVPTMGIMGLPLGSFGTNAIWIWPPWRGAENTIRGKVVFSPKSKPW